MQISEPCCQDPNILCLITKGTVTLLKSTIFPKIFSSATEISKIAAVAKDSIAQATTDDLFIVGQSTSPLQIPLLVDKPRSIVTLLLNEKLPFFSPGNMGSIGLSLEVTVNEQEASFIFRRVVQKQALPKCKLSLIEVQFTRLYGPIRSTLFPLTPNSKEQRLIIMEAFDLDLAQAFEKKLPLSAIQKVHIVYAIFQKLKMMHEAKRAHFDIKIENIFITTTCDQHTTTALGDFGLGKDKQKMEKFLIPAYGSPLYTAPELWEYDVTQQELPIETVLPLDMFALGCVVYCLISNKHRSLFIDNQLRKAYDLRYQTLLQVKDNQPIRTDYYTYMKSCLASYTKRLTTQRDKLQKLFMDKGLTQELSADECLASLAFSLLEPDPADRLTAASGIQRIEGNWTKWKKTDTVTNSSDI